MANKKTKSLAGKNFSRRFDEALAETLLIDAMVKADGWKLEQFVTAPPWLHELYSRHAAATRAELLKLKKNTALGETVN